MSFCDSVKLFADNQVICAGQPILFTCRRNEECGSRPVWSFPKTNLVADSILNDSTLRLVYKDELSEKVRISMTGTCKDLSDSVSFRVLPVEKGVSLGPDQYLCHDSSIVLRSGGGYSLYRWQDGSAADTLRVSSPGKYSVSVINSCGVTSSDTVLIVDGSAGVFSAGRDSTYCFPDAVTLRASPGFMNYLWTNSRGPGVASGQSVKVYPNSSTSFYASALTVEGCPMKDTVDISIKQSAPINLGSDTSFCSGDSVLLDAGPGFQQYTWNTGATWSTIWAHSTGTYIVRALQANGCYSRDTLIVRSLFPLPSLSLDKDSTLCAGTSRVLDAGSHFKSYQWQDGTGSPTITINSTGLYSVKVESSQGCFRSDTVTITKILPLPSDFLATDTVICDGFPSVIHAFPGYKSYLWSTGNSGDSITTRTASSYSLTVTDDFGCAGTASINVSTKQCLYGIFFPNAFTPNHDGRNDLYKPVVLGNLVKYHLQIFNRWGQRIFDTEDYRKGWNGAMESMAQGTSSFVWFCTYQFSDGPEKNETGTFVLML